MKRVLYQCLTAAFLPQTYEKPFLFRGRNGNHRLHKNEPLLYSYYYCKVKS